MGTCFETSDNQHGYTCDCVAPWVGRNCDVDNDPCSSGPCLNEGTCITLSSKFYECQCGEIYFGVNCELQDSNAGGIFGPVVFALVLSVALGAMWMRGNVAEAEQKKRSRKASVSEKRKPSSKKKPSGKGGRGKSPKKS